MPGKGEKRLSQDRRAGLKTARSGKRYVSGYDPDVALQICEKIAEGYTLKALTEKNNQWGFPTRETFRRWVLDYPEVSRAYAAAREMSAHALEEEALQMAYELRTGAVPKDRVRAFDVAMNQLRWSASKRNPRVYSEKAQQNFTVPIQINTSLDLGDGGQPALDSSVYQIEATVVEGEDPSHPNRLLMDERTSRVVKKKKGGKKDGGGGVAELAGPAGES